MKAAASSTCPPDSDWVDYHRGLLSDAEWQRLADHAATCSSCREAMEDARAFLSAQVEVSSAQVSDDVDAVLRSVGKRAAPRRLPLWETIAAALALTAGGEAYWLVQARSQQSELAARLSAADAEQRRLSATLSAMREPWPNTEIIDLTTKPVEVRSGGAANGVVRTIPGERALTLLIVHRPAAGARIEMLAENGNTVLTQIGFDPNSNQLSMTVRGGVLVAGRYTIFLMEGGRRTRLYPDLVITGRQ